MKMLKVGWELIVRKKPVVHDVVDVTDWRSCPYCLVFITNKEMWYHVKRYPANIGEYDCKSLKKLELLLFPNKYFEGTLKELKVLVLYWVPCSTIIHPVWFSKTSSLRLWVTFYYPHLELGEVPYYKEYDHQHVCWFVFVKDTT